MKKGCTIYWAANAIAYETIPENRVNQKKLQWRRNIYLYSETGKEVLSIASKDTCQRRLFNIRSPGQSAYIFPGQMEVLGYSEDIRRHWRDCRIIQHSVS